MAKQQKPQRDPSTVVLSTHRISYVHLKEPNAFEGKDPRYNCTFIIPENHPDIHKIKQAVQFVFEQEKNGKLKGIKLTSPNFKNPLRDGDEKPENPEYAGCFFIKADSKNQPLILDSDKQEMLDLDDIYSGAYARAELKFVAFDNVSKGIKCFLNSVMKTRDGERLGGFTADPNAFDEEEDETEIDDLN